jgi:hypothetical protein
MSLGLEMLDSSIERESYSSDVTDDEWAFVARPMRFTHEMTLHNQRSEKLAPEKDMP